MRTQHYFIVALFLVGLALILLNRGSKDHLLDFGAFGQKENSHPNGASPLSIEAPLTSTRRIHLL
jgi:hypothetical protein